MSKLTKPELRGHLNRYIMKTLAGAFIFAGVNCTIFYFTYMEPRKRAYAEFARTYNAEEHLKFLAKNGYLQSVKK